MWQVGPIPPELCEKYPELRKLGLYRALDDGKWEVYQYCNIRWLESQGHKFFAIYDTDLNRILDSTLPKK